MTHTKGDIVPLEFTCRIVYNTTFYEFKTKRIKSIIRYLESRKKKKKNEIKFFVPQNYYECCVNCYIFSDSREQFNKYVDFFKEYEI